MWKSVAYIKMHIMVRSDLRQFFGSSSQQLLKVVFRVRSEISQWNLIHILLALCTRWFSSVVHKIIFFENA